MNNQIQQTEYILPLTYLNNGLISSEWTDPTYLLLEDDLTGESNSSQSANADIMLGNYNLNIPVGAVVTGIKFKVIGYTGSITVPPSSLTFNAVDDTTGTIIYYPYTAPFTGFTQSMAEYIFGSENYTFGHDWTVDEINNFKLQLIGAGDLFIDTVAVQVFYYEPGTATPAVEITEFCETCESQIQGVEYFLALELLATDTKAYLYNFNYADGTPIQIADLGDCGGTIDMVIDEGKIATNGSTFMENVRVVDINRLPSGLVELDFGTLSNRGLMFKTPYTHDAALTVAHGVNAKIIISNDAPFYDKYIKKCQKGVLFSAPIDVLDEGVVAVESMEKLNFIGPNVQAEVDPSDPTQANVTILNAPTNDEPTVEDTSDGTTGAGTATSLTIAHTITSANYLRVWVSTDDISISSVTYNGNAMTLVAAKTNAPANLKVALYGIINPTAGTHNIVITMASAAHISGGGVSFTSVDTSNPTDGTSAGAIGSSVSPSDSGTTTTQNSVVQDVVGGINNTTAFTQTTPWNILAQINAAARPGATSLRRVLVPATVTDTYTINPTGSWAIIMAGVRGVSLPSASGVQTVTGLDTDNTDPANPIINIAVDPATLSGDGTPLSPLTVIGGGGGGGSTPFTITQTSHGFAVGDIIRPDVNQWALSQADTTTHAEAWAQVTAVTNANVFVALPLLGTRQQTAGIIALIAGFTGGDPLYVDETTPGAFTNIEPTTAGTVSKPIGYVEADSGGTPISLLTVNYRGQENQSLTLSPGAVNTKNGTTTKDASDASGVQTIPHGLGEIPSEVRISAFSKLTSVVNDTVPIQAEAVYNGTTQSAISIYAVTAAASTVAIDNTFTLTATSAGVVTSQVGVITFDATNIYITWTKTGSPAGTYQLLWEAIGSASVAANTPTHTNGSTTKNAADASGVQTIAHGLPSIPKKATITCTCTDAGTAGAGKAFLARAVYNGTTQSSQSTHIDSTGGLSDNTFTLGITGSTGVPGGQTGVVTFDATNIYIAWTKTGTPVGTYQLVWEAEA